MSLGNSFKKAAKEFHWYNLPDLSINIIFILITPVVGLILSNPKIIIYSAWIGVSLLLCCFANRLDHHVAIAQSSGPAIMNRPKLKIYGTWAVVSLMLFIVSKMIVASVISESKTESQNKADTKSIPTHKEIPLDTNKYVIKGDWNQEIAEKIVYKILRQYGGVKEYGFEELARDDKLSHKIVGFYNLTYIDSPVVVAVAYTKPEGVFSCRICDPVVGIIEFLKRGEGWVLGIAQPWVSSSGYEGDPPKISVLDIGYNIFGVFIEDLYMYGDGRGITQVDTLIFSQVAGEFRNVFSETTDYENSTDSWRATITFNKQGTSFYDLVMQKEGRAEGKRIKSKSVYKFDGNRYSVSDLYK